MSDHGSYEFSDALEAAEAAALEQQIAESEAEAAALDLELTGDPWEKRLGGWIWLALATIAVLIQGKHTWTPVQIFVGATLVMLPGATLMAMFRLRTGSTATRIVVAGASGIFAITVVDFIVSMLGPHVGIQRPLDPTPQKWIWLVVIAVGLTYNSFKKRDPFSLVFDQVTPAHLGVGSLLALSPILAALGAGQLNMGNSNVVASISMALAVTLITSTVFLGWRHDTRFPMATSIYMASLAVVFAETLRGDHVPGWDVQQEFSTMTNTIAKGIWAIPTNHDPYSSMLSLTAMPASFHSLVNLDPNNYCRFVIPMLLALVPLGVYGKAKSLPRFISAHKISARPGIAALVGAAFVIGEASFPEEIPAVGRQALASLMLTAGLVVLLDRATGRGVAKIYATGLFASLAWVHYSSSFLISGFVFGGWCIAVASTWWLKGHHISPKKIRRHHDAEHISRSRMLTLPMVAIIIGSAVVWNLVITKNNALQRPSQGLASAGLTIQVSIQKGSASAASYEKYINQQMKQFKWFHPYPGASTYRLENAKAPTVKPIIALKPSQWNLLLVGSRDIQNVLAAFGIAFLGWVGIVKRRYFNADLFGIGATALVIGAAFRFSATLDVFFSPARAAYMVSIILAVSIAVMLDEIPERFIKYAASISIPLTVILVMSSTLVIIPLIGGSPTYTMSTIGEDAQRFIVYSPEIAGATWLREHTTDKMLVEADRFGSVALLAVPPPASVMSQIAPQGIARFAWVYTTPTNNILGTARGGASTFAVATIKFPAPFFNNNLYLVYSNGSTRVYH